MKLCYILLCSMLVLSACEKKACYTCTITNNVVTTPVTQDYCDMTEKEIKEKEGTIVTTIESGGKNVPVDQTTTCVKKSK